MNFRTFSDYLRRIETVSSRTEMTSLLSEMFGKSDEKEVAVMCYLVNARVAPLFIPIEFNVADQTIAKALQVIVNNSGFTDDVAGDVRRVGDSGSVAENIVSRIENGKRHSRSVLDVYDLLWDIAVQGGAGSSEQRQKLITELIGGLSPVEAKYVVRILSQRLRLGAAGKTILDALSLRVRGDKRDRDELERAYGVCADLGYIAQGYLRGGVNCLKRIGVTPGVPVLPMLVEREKDAETIMKRMKKAIVQSKFDGIRCQIHIGVGEKKRMDDRVWWKRWKNLQNHGKLSLFGSDDAEKEVRLFSRNLEDMTRMFPEIVREARKLNVDTAVLDAEIVGYDDAKGLFEVFQNTMTRKRKYNVDKHVEDMPVKAFVFDVLYENGKDLLKTTNISRVVRMTNIIGTKGLIRSVGSPVVTSARQLQKLFEEKISRGLEGVVVKNVDSVYEPGVRGLMWLKLKRAFQGHLADTIDIVVLGYYFGKGKQAALGIGAILGGVYDTETDMFVTIAKVGGLKESQWISVKKELDSLAVKSMPSMVSVNRSQLPDVWVQPKIVATVEADEITRSPIHTAGARGGSTGFGLRFPRMKVWGRDKLPEDATSVREVERMFRTSGSKSAVR